MNINQINEIKENGITTVKSFLNENELSIIKDIVQTYSASKGGSKSYFSTNWKLLLYKIPTFQFKKLKHDLTILKLADKKKLNEFANKFFGVKSFLKFIDGYYSPIKDQDVLPWHTDQAYEGVEKNFEGFVNPEHAHLKFFIYLTDVGPDNGCTSYIPKSHKIGYALRKGIYEKKIKFEPYFLLKDFRNFISKNENKSYINNFLKDNSIIDNFLDDTSFIKENKNSKKFDFSLKAGDMIIFDEGGVHKGSKSLINERLILRYLYSIRK
jgi:hypothetical protein